MKTTLTECNEPFEFYVVVFFDRKTHKVVSYYKNTWKRVNTPVEAMHFRTRTWAQKRADENTRDDIEAKVIRYRAEFMSYEIYFIPADTGK